MTAFGISVVMDILAGSYLLWMGYSMRITGGYWLLSSLMFKLLPIILGTWLMTTAFMQLIR